MLLACLFVGFSACAGQNSSPPPVVAEPELPPPAAVQVSRYEPESVAEPTSIAPTKWRVLGPFSNPASKDGTGREGMAHDFLTPLGGEARAVINAQSSVEHEGKSLHAQAGHSDKDGVLDLIPLYEPGTDMKLAYAYAELSVERPFHALALFGSDDSAVVWVNGKEVHRVVKDRALNPDDDRFEMPLQKGQNRILVKVDNGQGGWGFALRLYDEAAKKQLQTFELRRHLESIRVVPDSETFILKATFGGWQSNEDWGDRFATMVAENMQVKK